LLSNCSDDREFAYTIAMRDDRMVQAALKTVADACVIARHVQRDLERVRRITKDDKSPVTVADFAVQAIVAFDLAEQLGEATIVGEESAGALRTPDQSHVLEAVVDAVRRHRPGASTDDVLHAIDACNHDATSNAYWTLDPVDGTKGFLRGQQYAIALARIEGGNVTIGVMGCPNLPLNHVALLDVADASGTLYAARTGGGAWEYANADAGERPRRVHAAQFVQGQTIRVCESVEAAHSKQDDAARVLAELGAQRSPARLDSQCKYALVARGQADAYMRFPTGKAYVEKIWDHAAGMIIAQEAGAIVSDISGSPLDFTHGRRLERNRGIITATRGLHEQIITAIDRLGVGVAV
jgi:3'(2'), 5'-bisphosphate nucleotidase